MPSERNIAIAAQIWCLPQNSDTVMDEKLAYAFADALEAKDAERDVLVKALQDYGEHGWSMQEQRECPQALGDFAEDDCTCGLDTLLAQYPEKT